MKLSTLITVAAWALSSAAFAQTTPTVTPTATPKDPTATPRIDKREAYQQKRIDQRVTSGQLTLKEQANLQKRESKIAADEAAAKADGKVTKAERVHLKREENRASKRIYKQKHDRQVVTPAAA